MSAGLPDANPWASCWPRSDATITFAVLPVCFDQARAALLTAKVSAGPELPISAVIVIPALWLCCPATATPVVRASAATATTSVATCQRTPRVVRCAFTSEFPSFVLNGTASSRPRGGENTAFTTLFQARTDLTSRPSAGKTPARDGSGSHHARPDRRCRRACRRRHRHGLPRPERPRPRRDGDARARARGDSHPGVPPELGRPGAVAQADAR